MKIKISDAYLAGNDTGIYAQATIAGKDKHSTKKEVKKYGKSISTNFSVKVNNFDSLLKPKQFKEVRKNFNEVAKLLEKMCNKKFKHVHVKDANEFSKKIAKYLENQIKKF